MDKKDVIYRQAAIDAVRGRFSMPVDNLIVEVIGNLPSAQPERKKGKWICWYEEIEDDTCIEYIPHCKCSECGKEYDPHIVKFINFCSYCGAKMQLSKEDATFKGGTHED